ncbi:putative AC transposase [Trichonephila clavipes]|nr:putative AC transposase [Trichonephila clavipes]
MTELDVLPFQVFCTSTELRKSLSVRGFKNLPTSINTIRTVINYIKGARNSLKHELLELKVNGEKFCLTFDEWMSVRNRRYLNISIHSEKEFWNIGLTHVLGSMPAEKCVKVLKSKLAKQGLSLKEDIESITTDGATVMKTIVLCSWNSIKSHRCILPKNKEQKNSNTVCVGTETSDSDFEESESDTDNEEINNAIVEDIANEDKILTHQELLHIIN